MPVQKLLGVASLDGDRFSIWDVTLPLAPVMVGDTGAVANLNTLTYPVKVGANAVVGNRQSNEDQRLIDITNRAAPVSSGSVAGVPTNAEIRRPITDGIRAYAFSRTNDFFVVYTPTLPAGTLTRVVLSVAGQIDGVNNSRFSASGSLVYGASTDDAAIEIIDITNPAVPTRVGKVVITGASACTGLERVGNYLFVIDNVAGTLFVVDATTEAAPIAAPVESLSHASLVNVNVCKRSADGTKLYASGTGLAFVVIDISNPLAVSILGSVNLPAGNKLDMEVGTGGIVFVSNGADDSVQFVDVSVPAAPAILNEIQDGTILNNVAGVTYWEEGEEAKPDQPTIEGIVPGPISANFSGSIYAHPDPFVPHELTELEVDVAGGDFSSPVATFSGGPVPGGTVFGLNGLTDYIARLRYQNTNDQWSDWSPTVEFTTEVATQPDQPFIFIVSLTDLEATLESSPFHHSNPTKELAQIEWEIDLFVGDYSSPEFEIQTEVHPPWSNLFPGLDPETSYKARARHVTRDGVASEWSGDLPFTTNPEPGATRPTKPSITSVSSIEAREACFNASAYSSPVGSPQSMSEWAVLTSPAQPNGVVWSVVTSTFLTAFCSSSHPIYQLQPNYNHGVKVRYRDAALRWSAWSDPFSFTTLSAVRPPVFTDPVQGMPVNCGTDQTIEWDDLTYPVGTTYDVELSSDFGETWTRLSTAQSANTYEWAVPEVVTRFGYIFRVRANVPVHGTGAWGHLSLVIDCGNAIHKGPPFLLSEWTAIWDVHRAIWGPTYESPYLQCLFARGQLNFPAGTRLLPQSFHDWSLLYHPDFGQVLDCDMEIHIWEAVETIYQQYGWKTYSEREHPMGLGIMGTGERVPYEDVPPGDPIDPANSYFDQLQGLTGIIATFEIENPWPLSELPPIGFFGGPIFDWPNFNLGCGSPTYGRRLGFGKPKLRLRIMDGGPALFYEKIHYWPSGVEAPVQDFVQDDTWFPCNYFPTYGVRLSIRTLNIRENGNRDLRIRVALTGPLDQGYGDGRWVINEVVENVPIVCGWPGAVTHMRTTDGFGSSIHRFDSLTVVPYEYGDCLPGVEEPAINPVLVPSAPGLCPDPEPVTNPPLFFGRYLEIDPSSGFPEDAQLLLYSKSQFDVDVPIPCKVTSREVSPRSTRGDALFRNVYLVIAGRSSGFVIVTPIVDGELKTDCARSFIVDWDPENPTPAFVRRYEIALYEEIESESHIGKRGLRGTHFKLRVEITRTWDCGQLWLEGMDLEWDAATERHNEVVEVPEPWVKTTPYDAAHLFFGSHIIPESDGVLEDGRLLEYGGNPESESAFVQDDDGAAIDYRARSVPFAPYGVSGEGIFRNVYLGFVRYNRVPITVNVTPIVDNTLYPSIAVLLPAVNGPVRDIREIALAQDVLVAGQVIGRRALRGCWFRLELQIPGGVPEGLVYIESRGLEADPAKESEVNVP